MAAMNNGEPTIEDLARQFCEDGKRERQKKLPRPGMALLKKHRCRRRAKDQMARASRRRNRGR